MLGSGPGNGCDVSCLFAQDSCSSLPRIPCRLCRVQSGWTTMDHSDLLPGLWVDKSKGRLQQEKLFFGGKKKNVINQSAGAAWTDKKEWKNHHSSAAGQQQQDGGKNYTKSSCTHLRVQGKNDERSSLSQHVSWLERDCQHNRYNNNYWTSNHRSSRL